MSRFQEIQEFLMAIKTGVLELEELQQNSIHSKSQKTLSITKVSTVFNHLRTILDYLSADILETIIIPSLPPNTDLVKLKRNSYFPYGDTLLSFNSTIGRTHKNLKTLSPTIYLLIENIQPHKSGDFTIYDLASSNNTIKHDTSKQNRKNKNIVHIGKLPDSNVGLINVSDDSENVTIKNVYTSYGEINAKIGNSNDESTLQTESDQIRFETIDTKFYFPHCQTDILTLLNNSQSLVLQLVTQVYQLLPK